jgi:putative oxidoreductase
VTSQSNDAHWSRPGESPEPIPGRPASARLVDPEDDLTPVGYPGDFGTTTVIPYSDPAASGGPAAGGYHLLDQQEPLPYVQPQAVAQPAPISATEPARTDADEDNARARAGDRRGTQHLGLLVLRVGLGVVLAAHGLQKLTGWWGGSGVTGLKNSLSDVGYQHADILAYVSAGGELAAGVLLVLGLFTPIAAAGALAFLINGLLATISARPHSFSYFLPQGHEYQITLIAMAAAVILCGPGRYGLDAGRGWALRPFIGSFVALLAGIAAGIAVWVLLNGVNPIA